MTNISEPEEVIYLLSSDTPQKNVWVVLLGISGMLLAILATVLLLTLLSVKTDRMASSLAISFILVAFTFLLILTAVANNILVSFRGQFGINATALITSVACVLALGFDVHAFVFILTPLLLASYLLLWGAFLSTLEHSSLQVVVVFSILLSGVALLFISQLDYLRQVIFILVAFVLSWGMLFALKSMKSFKIPAIGKALSKERVCQERGMRSGLFTTGLLLGAATTIVFNLQADYRISLSIIGISALFSSAIAYLFWVTKQSAFEDYTHRGLAIMIAIGVLPLPILPPIGQLICGFLLLCAAFVGLIITVVVMSELARFNQASPFWTFGSETFIYSIGIVIGQIVFSWGFNASLNIFPPLTVACIITVIAAEALQLVTNNHDFRFMKYYIDETVAMGGVDDVSIQPTPKKGRLWKRKLAAVATTNKLSPRQREVLELLSIGRNVDYITKHFSISRATAKTHVYTIFRKLRIHSTQELFVLIENILIEQNKENERESPKRP